MNFTQIQARAAQLASFEGWTDVSPAPDWPTLTNQAWQEYSWLAECVIGSETPFPSVIGQVQYQLTGVYKALLDVTFNSAKLIRSNEEYERNLNPFWLGQANGTPLRWTLSAFSVLTLVPPPSTVATINVRGIQQGPAMVAGTDQPGQVSGAGVAIPAIFHEAVCLRACVLHGQLYAQGDALQRLAGYQTRFEQFVADSRESLTTGYMRRKATGQ